MPRNSYREGFATGWLAASKAVMVAMSTEEPTSTPPLEMAGSPPRRRRGRPPKSLAMAQPQKRRRGRPRKSETA
jgi:hypothetical protein